jgi:hypothetical protein
MFRITDVFIENLTHAELIMICPSDDSPKNVSPHFIDGSLQIRDDLSFFRIILLNVL